MTAGRELMGEEVTEVVGDGTPVVTVFVRSEGGRRVCEDWIPVCEEEGISGTEARRKHL